MKSIAIIPARGGSVRVPGKNLALFSGKPALAIVLETVRLSGVFESVLVSSDDAEILDAARRTGAEPVTRPAHLADNITPILPVVQHALEAWKGNADAVCMVVPTAVFIEQRDLIRAGELLSTEPELDYVIGVKRFESAPQRALSMTPDGHVGMENRAAVDTRSQDLAPLFHDAGMFSFGRVAAWRRGVHSFLARTKGVEIERYRAIDIDTPEDLEFARAVYHWRKQMP
ncbi:pseudaminic acid cytidylyltransferase [Roseibium aquae]|uniref:Pseudaminic acid cytidylyltransferase n=1 Tax=Roseibium aquae TaxID=1323746 RepID=A0A916THS1_9HYPH|nr:pseudaminic acid cytidylyltransferase [Roseibium aquae]GGB45700.1 pseudaminic acid cytidylyltransferase [Roseibium aquae]